MANLCNGGTAIGVVAHPLLLKWNGMRWGPKRAMNNRPMNAIEAKNLPTLVAENVKMKVKALKLR